MMIRLTPMTEDDYQAYLNYVVPIYAAEKVAVGNWTQAEALERSAREYDTYLPQGIHTSGQWIYTLNNEQDETVGFLWVGRLEKYPDVAFIYDFEIYSTYQRRGYARQALELLTVQAKAQGFRRIELHVFGNNTAARELYRKSGFVETNVQMALDL